MKKLVLTYILAVTALTLWAQPPLKEGLKHLQNENYEDALKIFNAIAKADPKNGTIYYYIGEVSYLKEDYGEAQRMYNKGLDINSQCAECKVGQGKLLLDQGKADEANEKFESAMRLDKKNSEIYAMIGDAYLYGKKPDAQKAIENLTKAKAMNPSKAKYWDHLGDAYDLAGDNGEAMTNYEGAIEKDPKYSSAYSKIARIWARAKLYDLAIPKLEEAIKLAPDDAQPYKDLVELYIRTQQYDKVTPLLEKYITLIGTDIDARVRYIKYLVFQARDYDRAIEEGEELLKSYPDQYTLNRWLAWAHFEKGMYQDAYDHSKVLFDEIMKKEDRKAFASDYEYWAKSAFKLGLLDEAAHIYRKFLELEPSHAHEVYGLLAKAYYDAKNYEQAIAYYVRKNEVKELNVADTYWLGLAYYFADKNETADSCFAKVISITPDYLPGYKMRIKIANIVDSMPVKQWLAKEPHEKFLAVAMNDKEKNKADIIGSANYLAYYYVQVANDTNFMVKAEAELNTSFTPKTWRVHCLNKAKEYYELILTLDPEDETANDYLRIVKEELSKSG